jgi:hypothetical protein
MKKPRRFIVEVHDDIDAQVAFLRCSSVASKGLISNNGKQHCYGSVFGDGIVIFTTLNRGGNERFRVSKEKP